MRCGEFDAVVRGTQSDQGGVLGGGVASGFGSVYTARVKRILMGVALLVVLLPVPASADFIDHFAVKDDVGAAKVPSTGTSRIMVVTIEVDGFQPLRQQNLETFFSPDPEPGARNFNDFYERTSLGAFHTEVDVLPPLHFDACPLPETYFGYEECSIPRGGGDTANQKLESLAVGLELMELVFDRVDAELDVDFSRYDINGPNGEPDGWTDGVLLMHNINFGGIALPIHFLRMERGALEYDGTKINIVAISESELVALHEFGHLLGWADLYDELRNTKGYQYSFMGSWQYDSDPPSIDAFSRIAAGWAQATLIAQGEERKDVRLRPTANTADILQIGEGQEYFLVENRGAVRDDYIDGDLLVRGLAVTHVNLDKYPDGRPDTWPIRLINCLNCDRWRPMLMNEQADGKFELQKPGFRRDDLGDLFQPGHELLPSADGTALGDDFQELSSNYYDGAASGVSITNIRYDGDDILVDVKVEEPCASIDCPCGCAEGRCTLDCPAPDVGMDAGDVGVDDASEQDAEPPAAKREDSGCATALAPASGWRLLLRR